MTLDTCDQVWLRRRPEAENQQESPELEARPARPGSAASGPSVRGECQRSERRRISPGGSEVKQRTQPHSGGGQARQQVSKLSYHILSYHYNLILIYLIKCLNISGARIAPRDKEAELSQSPPARPRTAPHRSPTRPNYREEVSGK